MRHDTTTLALSFSSVCSGLFRPCPKTQETVTIQDSYCIPYAAYLGTGSTSEEEKVKEVQKQKEMDKKGAAKQF